jgi:glucokinase
MAEDDPKTGIREGKGAAALDADAGEPVRILAMDIGGSHATAAVVDLATGGMVKGAPVRKTTDPSASAEAILRGWISSAREALDAAGEPGVSGAGIAIPGPFDYDRGICLIRGLGKLESLYGMNIRRAFKARLARLAGVPVIFRNDATCFGIGEVWRGGARNCGNVICLTLGTGFGSSFIRDGVVVEAGDNVPPGGFLYSAAFRDGTAEDAFSSRGLVTRYAASEGGAEVDGAREIAERAVGGDEAARRVFMEYGVALGEFLEPWVRGFRAQCVAVGGNIARAWEWFVPGLRSRLAASLPGVELRQAELFEDAALFGAARLPLLYREVNDDGENAGE